MKAAVLVFLASVLFLAAALTGVVRVGSSQSAPRPIELPKVAAQGIGTVGSSKSKEVRQNVQSGLVVGYPLRTTGRP